MNIRLTIIKKESVKIISIQYVKYVNLPENPLFRHVTNLLNL